MNIQKVDETTILRVTENKQLLSKQELEKQKKSFQDRIIEIDEMLALFDQPEEK